MLPSLKKLWLIMTEILSVLNDIYSNDFEKIKNVVYSL